MSLADIHKAVAESITEGGAGHAMARYGLDSEEATLVALAAGWNFEKTGAAFIHGLMCGAAYQKAKEAE